MRFAIALVLCASVTAAHAQRMQPGDICDFLGADESCQGYSPGPWMGKRVEIMSGPTANGCPGQFSIMVRPAYSGEQSWLVDGRAVRNCVDRSVAPETIALNRQAEANHLAEQHPHRRVRGGATADRRDGAASASS